MPTPTYTPLANITLGSSAASVTFSSISQAYRDLVLVLDTNWSAVNSSSWIAYRMNGDSGANYYNVVMRGDGSSASSGTGAGDNDGYITNTSVGYGNPAPKMNLIFNFQDYSATDKHKSTLVRLNDPANGVHATACRWASTSAVTSIAIRGGLSFAAGTTMALYGIASA